LCNSISHGKDNPDVKLSNDSVSSVGRSLSDDLNLSPSVQGGVVLPHVVDVLTGSVNSSKDYESSERLEGVSVVSVSWSGTGWAQEGQGVLQDVVEEEISSGLELIVDSTEQVDMVGIGLLHDEGQEGWEAGSRWMDLSPFVLANIILPEVVEEVQLAEEEVVVSSGSNHEGVGSDWPGSVEYSGGGNCSRWMELCHAVGKDIVAKQVIECEVGLGVKHRNLSSEEVCVAG